MNTRAILIMLIAVAVCPARADEGLTFLNPGVKLGYSFGQGGGFTVGWEVSVTHWGEDWRVIPGVVVGIYWTRDRTVYHAGVQVTGPGLVGVECGPAHIREHQESDVGVNLDVYWLFGVMPHYTHVFRWEDKADLNEAGLYLKLPVLLGGRISLGG